MLARAAGACLGLAGLLADKGSTATALDVCNMLEALSATAGAALRGDTAEYAAGLADLLYAALWSAVVHGVPIETVFAEAQRANMAKFPVCSACEGSGVAPKGPASMAIGGGPDFDCAICAGKGRVVLRDAAGKVRKPEGWTPPDIRGVLRRAEEARGLVTEANAPGAESVKLPSFTAEAVKAPPAPDPNPAPMAEIIPWAWRPYWLVDLFANSVGVADGTESPEMTDAWWRQDWRKVVGQWVTGPRQSAEGWLAHDPAVALLVPVGAASTILDCISETFDYGSPVYWTEADTPYGRRLIALLTDS